MDGRKGTLTLVFDVQVNKKFGVIRRHIPDLVVHRSSNTNLKEIAEHLETYLLLPNRCGFTFLLLAVCSPNYAPTHIRPHSRGVWTLPLVCDQMVSSLITSYPFNQVKVLVERRPSCQPLLPLLLPCHSSRMLPQNELRYIDLRSYFPRRITRAHLLKLCKTIFVSDTHIKAEMRRGIWFHLLKAYPKALESQEDRELYVTKLRRVYDSLKGQWQGSERERDYHHLCASVNRDAIRTDPQESFFSGGTDIQSNEDNIRKLVNILAVYILEHSGVKYTQGMTDLLSPILYVMQREDDTYICFSAMLERIKENFGTWCEGTLIKIERLKHICMVLDPQLYSHLTNSMEEDAFALLFGMVLIECRREFSFADSFHLLEVMWAASLYLEMEGEDMELRERTEGEERSEESVDGDECSPAQWAGYMTSESSEVVQQVFGESPCPYSAQPLARTMSGNYSTAHSSRLPSMGSCGQFPNTQDADTADEEDRSPFEEIDGQERVLGGGVHETTHPIPEEPAMSHHSTDSLLQVERTEQSGHSENKAGNGDIGESVAYQQSHVVKRPQTELSDMSSPDSASTGLTSSHKLSDTTDSSRGEDDSASPGLVMQKENGESHSFYTATELSPSTASTSETCGEATATNDRVASHGIPPAQLAVATPAASGTARPFSHDSLLGLDSRPVSPLDARLSPVVFFDRFEQLASTIRSHHSRGATPRSFLHSGENSDISRTISLLLSTEQTAPQITRESSLHVPVYTSFPLFVCLAILVQNRARIMGDRLDFVGISVLLNTQAGMQDLEATLRVARHLLRVYQRYQLMYFGPGVRGRNLWLDGVMSTDSGEHDSTDSVQ